MIFTTDDTDDTDGMNPYPCHPCHPWFLKSSAEQHPGKSVATVSRNSSEREMNRGWRGLKQIFDPPICVDLRHPRSLSDSRCSGSAVAARTGHGRAAAKIVPRGPGMAVTRRNCSPRGRSWPWDGENGRVRAGHGRGAISRLPSRADHGRGPVKLLHFDRPTAVSR
jgi:hypothetical protein